MLGAVADLVTAKGLDGLNGLLEALAAWREWLAVDHFDRRTVNRRLRQYARGDEGWRRAGGEGEPGD